MLINMVQEFNSGNTECFKEILEMNRQIIYFYSKKYFADGLTQEDLFQEGAVGLWKAVRKFEISKGKFQSFAELHIKSSIINAVKTATRRKQRILNDSLSLYEHYSVEDTRELIETIQDKDVKTPEECFLFWEERSERIKQLNCYLEKLTIKERKVVTCILEGLNYNETANAAGMNYKSIDNALRRAKKKIHFIS